MSQIDVHENYLMIDFLNNTWGNLYCNTKTYYLYARQIDGRFSQQKQNVAEQQKHLALTATSQHLLQLRGTYCNFGGTYCNLQNSEMALTATSRDF